MVIRLQKILVPIDSIEYVNTLNGVKNAVKYASGCKAGHENPKLVFLHVLNSESINSVDDKERLGRIKKRKVEEDFKAIEEICDDHGIENVKTMIREGEPDKKIVEIAKEEDSDIIVMGSGKIQDRSATGRIKQFVYGSVTEEVLHEAPCSVLVARGNTAEDIDVCGYVPC